MIRALFRRPQRPDSTISTLYGTIVAQARLPCFYRDYAVPDTVNGRFDLLVLHLSLLLRRLGRDQELSRTLGQQVFDRFCRDMDDNLREMGITDLKMPKEMRRMGEAFYGRIRAYDAALAAADGAALAVALARNIYGAADGAAAASRLAAYVRDAASRLDRQPADDIAAGRLEFPDPAAIAAPAP